MPVDNSEPGTSASAETIKLDIPRSSKTHNRCVFGCVNATLHSVPEAVRQQVLRDFRYAILPGARVCTLHNVPKWTEVPPNPTNFDYTAADIQKMVDSLRSLHDRTKGSVFNFEFMDDDMDDKVVHSWTGLNKEQFNELMEETPSLSKCKQANTTLAMYLAKLRTGETDERLASLFNTSQTTANRLISTARKALLETFVKANIGFPNEENTSGLSREKVLENTSGMAKALFGNDDNPVITIWDGTYIYIQKSSDYTLQRQTYSSHKFRNLMKPMVAVTTNGFILDVFGPYAATEPDAKIFNDLIENNSDVSSFFQKDDIFVLDRGFRNSEEVLTAREFIFKSPSFIPRNQTQLTDREANLSRLITKIRFIVEAVNGLFKQLFRYFYHIFNNKAIPHLMDDFRIAAALINRFYPRIESDAGDVDEIATAMLAKVNEPNKLQLLVDSMRLNYKRVSFINLTEFEMDDFPEISEDELRLCISYGSYQIKQAKSYVAEHRKADGIYRISVHRQSPPLLLESCGIEADDPVLIRGKIQSRHRSNKQYCVYIMLDKGKEGVESIIGHYCQCKNGARTVGCCAHIMSIIWYLGYARHNLPITSPAAYLEDYYIVLEQSDDDEDDYAHVPSPEV